MKNYTGIGSRWPYTNAGSAIASGDVVTLKSGGAPGSVNLGIALDAIAASGGTGVLQVAGNFSLAKTSGEAYAPGDLLYWTGTALTSTSSGNTFAGPASAPSASADTTASVLLNSLPYGS